MLLISECMVIITHSDWHSTNERKFRINLKEHADFKSIVNSMKKHARLAKKEIVGDVTVELLQLNPLSLERGEIKIIDHKRFIMFDGLKVNRMIFDQTKGVYESKEVKECETIYDATNFIFDDIRNDLTESKKALKELEQIANSGE